MRIGLRVGPEQGRYRERVARRGGDAEAAERGGFVSIRAPQRPRAASLAP